MEAVSEFDAIVEQSIKALSADARITNWQAKEHNWVSYFAFQHLLRHCRPEGVISHPGQIGIEVGVPQPPDCGFAAQATRRDLVIWPTTGMTCWDADWNPVHHPLAILERKVHRPGRKNRFVAHERRWLNSYCTWQQSVIAYAIEIDGSINPSTITCSRFLGSEERTDWLKVQIATAVSRQPRAD